MLRRYNLSIIVVIFIVFLLIWICIKSQQVVDMNNDYYPYVHFEILKPEIMPRNGDNTFLLVLINSGATSKYRQRRNNIRQTWGNHDMLCDQKIVFQWNLVFVVGQSGEYDDDILNVKEASINQDMLIGNIEENYINNINKLYMAFSWISSLSNISYILKTDDDVYIRIPQVLEYIVEKQFPKQLYAGATYFDKCWRGVNRNPNSKWGLSRRYYDNNLWPPFNPGAFILISQDTIHGLLGYVRFQKPFHMDDAYVGMAFNAMNIYPTQIHSFVIIRDTVAIDEVLLKKKDCFLLAVTAIGHNIEPKLMMTFHNRIQELCSDKFKMVNIKPCHKQLQDTTLFNM